MDSSFSEDIEGFVEKYNVRRSCILRSLCLKTGLQLSMREYQFDQINKSSKNNNECFTDDDIINIYPIIKQVPPKVKFSKIFMVTNRITVRCFFS